MKKLVVVSALLAKAHYDSFTKKDGTFVQAHDDKRAAAKPAGPKPGHMDVGSLAAGHHLFDKNGQKVDEVESVEKHPMGGLRVNTRAGYSHMVSKDGRNDHGLTNKAPGGSEPKMVLPKKKPAADPYGHPNVVGKAEKLQGGAADKAHGFHFAGKQFSATGKSGTSHHDGTPVRHFKEVTESGADDGQHLWMDHSARVHADASSEVKGLRAQYEAHAKKPAGGAMGPDEVKQHAVAAGAKFRSNVSVFSKPELAHSFANQTQGSKGSAFVMKHPDHQHHVVVGGADAQRMEKNGYQHVRPGA